jgi:iron complex outermembrane receptor protein
MNLQKKVIIPLILAPFISSEGWADTQLDTVTVTATRSEESVDKQPLSISKKSSSEIQLDQVGVQKDLLNSIAGVSIKQTGSVVGNTTAIRTPDTTLPYFLYLQDGIPVQSSGFFNHNALAYTDEPS